LVDGDFIVKMRNVIVRVLLLVVIASIIAGAARAQEHRHPVQDIPLALKT
jgi:hypothetical protein